MKSKVTYAVMILAAGVGKRMHSPIPKVLHEITGKPLIYHVLSRILEVAPQISIGIVIGYGREQVQDYISHDPQFRTMNIHFIVQEDQRGTGHAARCAMDSQWGEEQVQSNASILVLPGDLPLISSSLVSQMLIPLARGEVLRLLTCHLSDPFGYGRVLRKGKTDFVKKIVEEKDATVKEKGIKEVAASIYLFQSLFLKNGLQGLSSENAQGEFYLTDLIEQGSKMKRKMGTLAWNVAEDLRGVNDLWELALADQILNDRHLRYWSAQGVQFVDPRSIRVDSTVKIEAGARIFPGTILRGSTGIGKNATIGPHVILKDVQVGSDAYIKAGSIAESSVIESGVQLGPYAHLRPESHVGKDSKIGNFVELKKVNIGEKTSIAHLSYLGDAVVGSNVNIGCGFVTCNFDGRILAGQRKHKTIIEDDVFLGSDCQAIAPVKIGRGSFIASGSTITEDVNPEDLAIARARQVNKPGYARKLRAQGKGEGT